MIDTEEDLDPDFSLLKHALIEWVRSNPKTCNHITGKNSKYMFSLDSKGCLTIDLNRFNQDYYREVFIMNQFARNRKAFLHKVCLVIRDTIIRINKRDIKLNIILKFWHSSEMTNVYIHHQYK